MLMRGVIFMNLALVFYTWAVFSGRKEGLHYKHLFVFGVGLIADFLGTREMNHVVMQFGKPPVWHTVTGIASLGGMAFHFLLALAASLMGRAEAINRVFHRVSLTIYSCWLVAFISGAVSGMLKLHR